MKRALLAVAVVAMLAIAPSASASTTSCNGTYTSATFDNVTVPTDGSCTLIASTVNGSVLVGKRAYFEAGATNISGYTTGLFAQTIYLHDGTNAGRSVTGFITRQVLVFDSTVQNGSLSAIGTPFSDGQVNICGANVSGDLNVIFSGTDILVGDPLTVDCTGNTIGDDLNISSNKTDSELVIRGNTINDDATVSHNKGISDKNVEGNIGGDRLSCKGNSSPFAASLNVGWNSKSGQCSGP
jgi:hypothetical protein